MSERGGGEDEGLLYGVGSMARNGIMARRIKEQEKKTVGGGFRLVSSGL